MAEVYDDLPPGFQVIPQKKADPVSDAAPADDKPGLLRQLAQPFVDIGKSALAANDFAARAITQPRETFKNPGAVMREGMRGVNSNIPFGGKLASLASGQPEQSLEDQASAPGAQAAGSIAGLPVGNMVGGIAGKAVEAAVPAVGRAIGRVGDHAESRVTGRAVEDLGVGAGKPANKAIQAKADEIGEAMAERPDLRKGAAIHASTGNSKLLASEAKKLSADGQSSLAKIYADAAKPDWQPPNYTPVDTSGVPEVVGGEPTAQMTSPNFKPPVTSNPSENATIKVPAETGEVPTPGGVPVPSVKAKLDARISKLREGNQTENDVADHLESIRDKLHSRIGTDGVVDPKKLRHEQSGYQGQGKYGKGSAAESVVAQANQEASEAVGDALLEHVTGLDYKGAVAQAEKDPSSLAGQVLKANGQVTAAMRIEQAIEARKGSNPGAPHRLTALVHGATHGIAGMGAIGATGLGHGGIGAAIAGADIARTLAPHVARRIDPAIIAIVKRAAAEGWDGKQLARAIAKAAPAANLASNLEGQP